MKESSCHNAKMAAYCREVRQLEDKFDGIELNHIPRHLNEVIQNRDAIERIAKWALELMGQGISYAPWTAIKSQVLADFITE